MKTEITEAERRALRKFRDGLELSFMEEGRVLNRFYEAAQKAGRPLPRSLKEVKVTDEAKSRVVPVRATLVRTAHDVPEKSFVADVRRKRKLRRVMPKPEPESAGSGEISDLLRAQEAFHASYHETPLESIDEFIAGTVRVARVWRESGAGVEAPTAVGMDGDHAEHRGEDEVGAEQEPGEKLGKTDQSVNYRLAQTDERSCSACKHWTPVSFADSIQMDDEIITEGVGDLGACALVRGVVRSVDTCDLFEPADDGGDENDQEED